jgi:hypothetical protein
MLCSVCADMRISQVVDQPNWVVSCYLPRLVLIEIVWPAMNKNEESCDEGFRTAKAMGRCRSSFMWASSAIVGGRRPVPTWSLAEAAKPYSGQTIRCVGDGYAPFLAYQSCRPSSPRSPASRWNEDRRTLRSWAKKCSPTS